VRGRLSPHKVPRVVSIVAELPKTPSGKIDRRALRE
jgi:acetyl-CoA synthetase